MSGLTHVDGTGSARMVDVGDKNRTKRSAMAIGHIEMDAAALAAVKDGNAAKGDVLGTARVAGIMAAKKTADLIPLCHPLELDAVAIDFEYEESSIAVTASVSLAGKTGVEMEALTAVSVALLTIYDMAKALDKTMAIGGIRVVSKMGGRSGDWYAPQSN